MTPIAKIEQLKARIARKKRNHKSCAAIRASKIIHACQPTNVLAAG